MHHLFQHRKLTVPSAPVPNYNNEQVFQLDGFSYPKFQHKGHIYIRAHPDYTTMNFLPVKGRVYRVNINSFHLTLWIYLWSAVLLYYTWPTFCESGPARHSSNTQCCDAGSTRNIVLWMLQCVWGNTLCFRRKNILVEEVPAKLTLRRTKTLEYTGRLFS